MREFQAVIAATTCLAAALAAASAALLLSSAAPQVPVKRLRRAGRGRARYHGGRGGHSRLGGRERRTGVQRVDVVLEPDVELFVGNTAALQEGALAAGGHVKQGDGRDIRLGAGRLGGATSTIHPCLASPGAVFFLCQHVARFAPGHGLKRQ